MVFDSIWIEISLLFHVIPHFLGGPIVESGIQDVFPNISVIQTLLPYFTHISYGMFGEACALVGRSCAR